MNVTLEKKLKIVTGIRVDGEPKLEDRNIDNLMEVLCRRTDRLVADPETRRKLKPTLKEFVLNILKYFDESGEMDEFVMTNIMTALATSDNHGPGGHGVEDYSTFIRRLNPTDPDTNNYFIIGRAGKINDSACPLNEIANKRWRSRIPKGQLHMFLAFQHARSKDATRDAPRIPVWDFGSLIPKAVKSDVALEEAFFDVTFSDGAWELYHLKLAA